MNFLRVTPKREYAVAVTEEVVGVGCGLASGILGMYTAGEMIYNAGTALCANLMGSSENFVTTDSIQRAAVVGGLLAVSGWLLGDSHDREVHAELLKISQTSVD